MLPLLLVAQIGSSQITSQPMEVVKAEDIEAREMQDGRVTQRVSAATVGLIKVDGRPARRQRRTTMPTSWYCMSSKGA